MIVELHLLQNFAPACLNRDDTNAPKDCEFGGYRRARISSQCIKRAVRRCFHDAHLLEDQCLSQRTRRVVEEATRQLVAQGKPEGQAKAATEAALRALGLGVDDGETQYLLFLGQQSIQRFAAVVTKHWSGLLDLAKSEPSDADAKKSSKDKKKEARKSVAADLRDALSCIFDGTQAADLALFGRMLADMPDRNIDAACQVAHALSTHRVNMEIDFYTAVDDLQPASDAGAGMMGTIEFNSSCFYRYANLDVAQLLTNLEDDRSLALKSVEAFLRASVLAVPTGKQTTMAAQNPPSFALAVVRAAGCWSLANAFVNPVSPRNNQSMVTQSILALDAYWERLAKAYGTDGFLVRPGFVVDEVDIQHAAEPKVQGLDQLCACVIEALRKYLPEAKL